MSRFFRSALGALIALSLAAALVVGCSDDEQAQQQEQSQQQPSAAQPQEQQEQSGDAAEEPVEPISVVVSSQVIADWVRQVGGDLVNVRALVPAGADAHTVELTVDDIRAIADADLVIINGAGLEASYADAILENTDSLLDLAEALEAAGHELHAFEGMMSLDDEHDHQQQQQQHEQDEHEHDEDQQHQQDHDQHEQDEHDHDEDQQHQQDHDQHEQDEHDHDEDQQHQQDHDQHEQDEHDHDEDQQHQQDHDQHEQDEHDHDEDQQHQQDHEQHEQDEHDHDEDQHEQQEHQQDQEQHEQDEHGHAHDHSGEDPHYWFDTDLAQAAVQAIADSLIELIPSAEAEISAQTESYLEEIREADAEVRSLLEGLTEQQRLLVTFHDAFGYFARRYGLQVAGFVVEGPEQGVSAESLTELIELIEHEGVQTVFHEPQFDSTILDTIASETGAERGIIWSQPTDDNPTYIGILVGNAKAVADQ